MVDDILFEKKYLLDYANVLQPKSSWLVAVTCDIEIVRARETKRSGRFPGTADSHFDSIHDHGVEYDIEVNTSRKSPAVLAKEIITGMKATPRASLVCLVAKAYLKNIGNLRSVRSLSSDISYLTGFETKVAPLSSIGWPISLGAHPKRYNHRGRHYDR